MSDRAQKRLDDRLSELAAGIVLRMRVDPPEVAVRLSPPQLRVLKEDALGVNCFCVHDEGGTSILMGGGLYPLVEYYTRAAASYFLPDATGSRPSAHWPSASSSLATALDWLASPLPEPRYPEFVLTPRQANVAEAFAAYAYRFALCHEMAHVVLEHVEADPTELREVGGRDVEVFRTSQRRELQADRFALDLQVKTLAQRSDLITALAAAVYFVHIVGLLDARLMLLAKLVDSSHWKISLSHPPTLHRIANLMGIAEGLETGAGKGLEDVHGRLEGIDGSIREAANEQRESVTAAALRLIEAEAARALLDDAPLSTRAELMQLFERSPLGILQALEPYATETLSDNGTAPEAIAVVVERVARELPPAFQAFHRQTRADRADTR